MRETTAIEVHNTMVSIKLAIVLLVTAAAAFASGEPNNVPPSFVPGKEVRLNAGKAVGEILVYVPADYNDTVNWPVIFYYHGQGEQLSTQRFQTATQGKGFIVVSMEFAPTVGEQMTNVQYLAYLQREIKNIGIVRQYLKDQLKTQPKGLILAGVSRGGWLVADIFNMHPQTWAAAAIMCAGYRSRSTEDRTSLAGKFIYIGAGETDQNLSAAKKAAAYFESRGADITSDVYAGLGHNVDPNSPKLKGWFLELREKLSRVAAKTQPADKAAGTKTTDKAGSREEKTSDKAAAEKEAQQGDSLLNDKTFAQVEEMVNEWNRTCRSGMQFNKREGHDMADWLKTFGKPLTTEVKSGTTFFGYKCSDGTIRMKMTFYGDPEQGGKMLVDEVTK